MYQRLLARTVAIPHHIEVPPMLRVRSKLSRKDFEPRRRRPGVEELEVRTLLSASMAVPAALIHPILHPAVSATTLTNPTQSPFTPSAIRAAYGFDQINFTDKNGATIAGNGAGQTIAIVDAFTDPNITADLATFDSTFGLPAPPSFNILNENGGTSLSGVPVSGASSFALEESIDVEWAHAIAPAANIVLFEAQPTNVDVDIADLTAATASTYTPLGIPAAGVVSNSFGSIEGTDPNVDETNTQEKFEDTNFFQPISAQQNVTIVAASGDFGVPEYPSVSPYVLSVGGTALTLQASGTNGVAYGSETGWSITENFNSPTDFIGGGGGTSLFENEPVFQSAVGIGAIGDNRNTPDVSIDASGSTPVNFVDSFDFPNANPAREFAFGTSIGAPMWSGLLAVVNQGRALQGKGPLANAQEAVYSIPTSDFHDITTGHNVLASAHAGYDEVTGLGTPIANRMAGDLVGATTGLVLIENFFPTDPPVGPPSGTGLAASGKAGVVSDNAALDAAAIAPRTVLESAVTHLDQRIPGDTAPAVAFAVAGLGAGRDAGQAAARPGGRTGAVEGVHADADVTVAASAASAATGESTPPLDSSDPVTPTAAPLVDFTTDLATASHDGGARDAVFASLNSDPRIECSTVKIEDQALAAPGILAGDETHSFDLAIMAGLALAAGGSWNATARSEETRKFPALRK
jgi:hypothetical protein